MEIKQVYIPFPYNMNFNITNGIYDKNMHMNLDEL